MRILVKTAWDTPIGFWQNPRQTGQRPENAAGPAACREGFGRPLVLGDGGLLSKMVRGSALEPLERRLPNRPPSGAFIPSDRLGGETGNVLHWASGSAAAACSAASRTWSARSRKAAMELLSLGTLSRVW